MKCFRILPEICASTLRCPGRSTRNMVPGSTWVTVPSVTICPSFDTCELYSSTPHCSTCLTNYRDVVRYPKVTRGDVALLTQLIPGDCRQIFPKFLAFPPGAALPAFLTVCKTIAIKHRSDVVGRFIRERVMLKQPGDVS